ncbi:MAG: hypothetical protein QOH58_3608 [Thermoleophilaceae bacterium]|jgi:hypothetical protein|nr:hypothetical protein [Thermoleophilaceae bacterium]
MRRANRRRLALACALAALAALGAAAGPAAANRLSCNGERRLCHRPLDQVVLPATHNSMSAQALGWQIPNQQVGIPEQLAAGVRGFLIDTYYAHVGPNGTLVNDPVPTPESGLYLCHIGCQLGATPLADALRAIRRFLRANPANVLVIINEDYTRPEDFAREVRRSGLLRHVYRGRLGPRWPTLRRLINRRKQVVMLTQGDGGPVPWYREGYQGLVQETPYNWPTVDPITNPANWNASCQPNRGGTTGGLFLLNHWSPPVAPNPAVSAVVNAAGTLEGRAKACRALRGRMPTLVAVDMFQSGGLFEAVHRLNSAIR